MTPTGIMVHSLMTLSSFLSVVQAFVPVYDVNSASQTGFDMNNYKPHKLAPLRYRNDDTILTDEHGTAVLSPDIYTIYKKKPTQTKYDLIWDQRLQELQDYWNEHGHCDVPNKVNGTLSRWIASQRRAYKLEQISPERLYALQSIQFPWTKAKSTTSDSEIASVEPNYNNDQAKKQRQEKVTKRTSWAVRLVQLKEFQNIHGHCIVPQHYAPNPGLGLWVKSQRRQYEVHRSSSNSKKMTSKIQMLNTIGFVWEVNIKDKTRYGRKDNTSQEVSNTDPGEGYVVPFDCENKTSQQLHSAWIDRFKVFI